LLVWVPFHPLGEELSKGLRAIFVHDAPFT
jgi:hypothetical protein